MNRTRLIGLIRLFRLELPVAAGACVVLGQVLALGNLPPVPLLLQGFLSFFFISATALILNDYFDLETDRINAPDRPLPSGMVTKRDVVLLSAAVALAGLFAGSLIGPLALLVVFIVWVVGLLYNWRIKRTGLLGNLFVSFSVGMTFIFGGITVGKPFDKVVWWFAVFAMLVDLGEEIAADATDVEGDRKAGSRSLAVLLGRQKALRLSGAVFLLVILVSAVPFILRWLSWQYLVPVLLFDGIIACSTARLLRPQTRDHLRYIKWIYLSGSVTILAIIVMRLIE
jgi:geranylgeranylglycerol-phosphate geranylgeranyltransferase